MDEQTANTKHRRKPFLAAFLSFISIGLGYVYCGRIVKGFLLFTVVILVHIASIAILEELPRINMIVIVVWILISFLIWIASIIDSYLIVRNTRPDYKLKDYNRWYVYLFFYLLITIYTNQSALNIKSNLMEAFRTASLSMFPTIKYHDCFLADKKAYKNDNPKRGDVIVFVSPEDRNVMWVKRVVAIAGDTVEMKDNQLFINTEKLEREGLGRTTCIGKDSDKKDVKVEGELFTEKNGLAEYMIYLEDTYDSNTFPNRWADFPKKKIPKNFCFVLGDNRNLSMDSRHWGSIPLSTVKGRAEYIYWPPRNWSRLE
jgi:signal peptidase I